MIYLYSFLGLGGLALLIWVVQSIKAWGVADLKEKEAEADAVQSKNNAQKWADANTVSASSRLRQLAKKLRGS